MAISFRVEFATSSSKCDVAAQLDEVGKNVGVLPPSSSPESLTGEGTTSRLGTWIRVTEDRPQPWSPVVTELGFTPTVTVVFRLAKGVEVSDQQDDMIRVVSPLLERVAGDAVLHLDLETIWLLRRRGDLSLNERGDLWTPRRLALMSQPYRRETHTMEADDD